MERDRKKREEFLLDFHLDQLADDDREWIEAELLRDAELRTKSDRLGSVLRPLDHWSVGQTPARLVDNILRAVEQPSAEKSSSRSRVSAGETYRPRSFFTLREVVAIAASIVLLMSVIIPGVSSARSRSQREACASNLGSVFRGLTLYEQSFGGSLPYAGSRPGTAWLPCDESGSACASNSRHPYLIARLNYAKPEDFVCPADKAGQPMRRDELALRDDFASAANMSYASLNLSGETPNLHPPGPLAYMSDRNPLFANARFNPGLDPAKANSPVHGKGSGQSVLFLDGSVRWMTTPIYGARRDNVWLMGDVREYVGTEAPTDQQDAFLIPGYPAGEPRKLD